VLEHNLDYEIVLRNVMQSFRKRLALVLFTPFSEQTHELSPGGLRDISFREEDITDFFSGCTFWREDLETDTQYREEHLFYVERLK
jgi:hypothetical protein